jgi:hypothetical protein
MYNNTFPSNVSVLQGTTLPPKPQQPQAQQQPQPQQPQTNYLQGGLPQQSPLDVPEGMYDYLNNRPISDQ